MPTCRTPPAGCHCCTCALLHLSSNIFPAVYSFTLIDSCPVSRDALLLPHRSWPSRTWPPRWPTCGWGCTPTSTTSSGAVGLHASAERKSTGSNAWMLGPWEHAWARKVTTSTGHDERVLHARAVLTRPCTVQHVNDTPPVVWCIPGPAARCTTPHWTTWAAWGRRCCASWRAWTP